MFWKTFVCGGRCALCNTCGGCESVPQCPSLEACNALRAHVVKSALCLRSHSSAYSEQNREQVPSTPPHLGLRSLLPNEVVLDLNSAEIYGCYV